MACLSIFLIINGRQLTASPDELTEKALWLAETTPHEDFDQIKMELIKWIEEKTAHIQVG